MILVVEKVTGGALSYSVDSFQTVRHLKNMICKTENIPIRCQGLVFREKEMSDFEKLQHYGICNESRIKLVVIARSGPIDYKGQQLISKKQEPMAYSSFDVMQWRDSTEDSLYGSVDNIHTSQSAIVAENKASESDKLQFAHNLMPLYPTTLSTFSDTQADKSSNLHTYCRMRDLRRSIECLKQEHLKRKQYAATKGFPIDGDLIPEGFKTRPGSWRSTFSQQRDCLFMSAEDTSAKESSAGETEFDDHTEMDVHNVGGMEEHLRNSLCDYQPKIGRWKSDRSHQSCKSSPTSSQIRLTCTRSSHNDRNRRDLTNQHKSLQKVPFARSSSCSDLDYESSAWFSSDFEIAVENESARKYEIPNEEFIQYVRPASIIEPSIYQPRHFVSNQSEDDYDVDDEDNYSGPASSGVLTCNELSSSLPPYRRCKIRKKTTSNSSHRNVNIAATSQRLYVLTVTSSSAASVTHQAHHVFKASATSNCAIGDTSLRRSTVNVLPPPPPSSSSSSSSPLLTSSNVTSPRSPTTDSIAFRASQFVETVPSAIDMHANVLISSKTFSESCNVRTGSSTPVTSTMPSQRRQRISSKSFIGGKVKPTTGEYDVEDDKTALELMPMSKMAVLSTATGDETSSDDQEVHRGKAAPYYMSGGQKYKIQTSKRFANAFVACPASSIAPLSPPIIGASSTVSSPPSVSTTTTTTMTTTLGIRQYKLPQSSQSQQRCNSCSCRLSATTTFQCRCGKTLCARHRHNPAHPCGHDARRLMTTTSATFCHR